MTAGLKDTIAAQATPPGVGGVGIIRISGFNLESLSQAILGQSLPKTRYALYSDFLDEDGSLIDQGIVLYFKAPHSFTGQDVIELQGHGGPVVMARLLKRVLSLDARMAKPGEFSERAFLNGKIDLAQAEAICDLINAQSDLAAKSAVQSLQGGFSKTIEALVESLTHLRMYIEAAIDFPDEEVDFLPKEKIGKKLGELLDRVLSVKKMAQRGEVLQKGVNIAIAGPPNSGKSSLLNQLSQKEVAIVTHIPGTTRDILRQEIQLDGLCLQMVDTAGIREETDDPVEIEGIQRARNVASNSDHILLVLDITQKEDLNKWLKEIPEGTSFTLVLNKLDLASSEATELSGGHKAVCISAKTGEGIKDLENHLKEVVGLNNVPEGQFIARARHVQAIEKAEIYLMQAVDCLASGSFELIAEELKHSQNALSEITGEFSADDLLGRIFQSFCIGK